MKNLNKIQSWLKTQKIDLFLINRTDEFFGEYIAPYAERLKWISNFSGSAGRAIILQNKAYIFVDGRYTLQVKQEVNKKYFKIKDLQDYWLILKNIIKEVNLVSLDPSLHSISEVTTIKKILGKKNLKFTKKNPIDLFWRNQPAYPKTKAFIHEKKYAGLSTKNKITKVQSLLRKHSIDYYFFTSLDSIAWLLNIRGNDIKYTPLTLSYLFLPCNGKAEIFIHQIKVDKIKRNLSKIINFNDFKKIDLYLQNLNSKKIIGFDTSKTNYSFKIKCENAKLDTYNLQDPCTFLKAQKNSVEIKGSINANKRDGLSLTKFLYWLKNNIKINKTNELNASNYLYNLRKKNKLFFSLSFESISAVGKHAAIPHYRLTKKSNLNFKKDIIYLIDSGVQYLDGTTDITRTIIIGKATKEQKDRYTRVLKGHIALARSKFNLDTKGSDLDKLARESLKEIGCDYNHGTGHGVGSFSSVHEGPIRIAKKNTSSNNQILEKMIFSNEPGYYKENQYGIRTENLVLSYKINNSTLGFKTISLAPFDNDLIEIGMLNQEEKKWLNNYHKEVFRNFSNKLNYKQQIWLKKVTKSI